MGAVKWISSSHILFLTDISQRAVYEEAQCLKKMSPELKAGAGGRVMAGPACLPGPGTCADHRTQRGLALRLWVGLWHNSTGSGLF